MNDEHEGKQADSEDWGASGPTEDGQVEILEAWGTGEHYRDRESTGVVQHQRSFPLPLRVRSGSISDEFLELEGAQVPWEDIQLIALGVIHHSLGSTEPPKTMVRQMFGKMMGKDDRGEKKGQNRQEFILLDLYLSSQDAPFRFDSASVNYREFLGSDLAFISMHNFYRLVVRLARKATQARINDNAFAFINRRREQIRPHGAVYDFELESQGGLRSRAGTLKTTLDVDLSRDHYTEEADDE